MPAVLVRIVQGTLYSSFKYIVPSYADADYGLCLNYLLVCTLYTVHCTLYSSFKYIVPIYDDADYGLCLQYLLICTLYNVQFL